MSTESEAAGQAAKESLEDPPGNTLAYIQEVAWDDLMTARRRSASGSWSMECDSIVYRIVWLTKHTGMPTGWSSVPVELVLDGTFEAIHEAIGMRTPLDDDARARAQRHYDEFISPYRPRRPQGLG